MRATRRFLRLGGIWRIGVGRLGGLHADVLHLGALRRLSVLLVLVLSVGTAWVGCDVHEFPEQKVPGRPDNPDGPDPGPGPIDPDVPKVAIPLRLEYETLFYLWEYSYDPLLAKVEEANPELTLYPDHPGTSACYDGALPVGRMQVVVQVFPTSGAAVCVADTTYERTIDGDGYDVDFEMALPDEGTYDVIVWSQLLAPGQEAPFYDAANFNRIHIVPDAYDGNTDYRDAFAGRIRIDAAAEIDGRYVVRMTRPMGKVELVTTDLSEFLDRETDTRHLSRRATPEDYSVVISYPLYYPSSYSARDDRLENSSSGVSFQTSMTVTGESEASLGFDYVMLNNIADGAVQLRVDIFRMDGSQAAGSGTLTVPMRRDHHTLLRGAFLSTQGSGGVGIDPGFNGDHNIFW